MQPEADRADAPAVEPANRLKLLFVIPWRDRGKWLWQHLPPGIQGDLAFAAAEPGSFFDRRRLPPYFGEWWNLLRRRIDWRRYDVIFTWELRSALATALLLLAVPRASRPRWVAVGPILKGGVLRALPLVRRLLSRADRIICFSRAECAAYATQLHYPTDRFIFLPTPWLSDESATDRDDGYILALGHSNRDYPTLLRAVAGTDLPVTIVAADPSALGGVEPTPNVRVCYNTGHDQTIDLIAGASFHCIPLHAAGYSAGQTVLLRAMARGKAVVVTETDGIRDYVANDKTAVLVPPGNANALRAALTALWTDPKARNRIGAAAARAVREEFGFERFTARLVQIARAVAPKK